ncbi:ABC transporter permease [Saccharopolyspora spinosporotrichia]
MAVLLQVVHALYDDRTGVSGADQFSSGLRLTTMIAAVLVSAIGVNVFGAEYRYRTIATTVLTVQSRARVVLAKVAVVAGFGASASLLAVLVDYLGVLLSGATTDDPVGMAVAGLGAVLYVTLSGLVGLALAGLARHAVAALAVVLLWPTVLEPLLVSGLEISPKVLPFLATGALAEVVPEPQWYLALPLAGLATILLVAAGTALSRRDT